MRAIARFFVAAAAVAGVGCANSRRVHHEDQFTLPTTFIGADPVEGLRAYLVDWHMNETDLDCFMSKAAKIAPKSGTWYPEFLNGIAAQCAIDLSDLWKDVSGGDVI